MLNDYSNIASSYDFLSRMVFSRAQVNAQVNQLHYIPENSVLLIAGGGTGWILEEIAKVHSAGLEIFYVEISSEMIELSKSRSFGTNTVHFICAGIETFHADQQFDVVLTPFLFDNFSSNRAAMVFNQLHQQLKKDALWLMVDFCLDEAQGLWWRKLFLKMMYRFFRIVSKVEANQLTDMSAHFNHENYQIVEQRFYYRKFIKAIVYQK